MGQGELCKFKFEERFLNDLASLGYDPDAAIADLIDNSWDARSRTRLTVEVRTYYRDGALYEIQVADNGHGMSLGDLKRAMNPGVDSGKGPGALGKYGAGLKLASFAIGHNLKVVSKMRGGSWHKVEMDNRQFSKGEFLFFKENDITTAETVLPSSTSASGTIVTLSRLKPDKFKKTRPGGIDSSFHDRLAAYFGLIYHRLIDGRKFKLVLVGIDQTGEEKINRRPVGPIDPFCKWKPSGAWPQSFSIQSGPFKVPFRLYVWKKHSNDPGYLLDCLGGTPKGQGFYIYRNSRLITWGGWAGIRNNETHMVLARVAVEMPYGSEESFNLTIMKDKAGLPADLAAKLQDKSTKAGHIWSEFIGLGSRRGKRAVIEKREVQSAVIAGRGFPLWLQRNTRRQHKESTMTISIACNGKGTETTWRDGRLVIPRYYKTRLTPSFLGLLFLLVKDYSTRERTSKEMLKVLRYIDFVLAKADG